MKKYLSLFTLLALVFVFNIANAEEAIPSTTSAGTGEEVPLTPSQKRAEMMRTLKTTAEENKEKRTEVREEMKSKIEEAKEEGRSKMDAFREKVDGVKDIKKQKALKVMLESRMRVFDGFTKALENTTKTATKVKEYTTKVEALGLDTTTAKANIVIVDTALLDAKAKIAEAATLLSAKTDKLTAEDKTKIKALSDGIKMDLKTARETLNSTTKTLKETLKNYKESLKASTVKENDN
ncbi:MAG: hypothetical protein NTW98_03185 [Candidatus Nomurabacteria bacterium]|nr:hypothetical protein [Candidatus Nomurabacteria bacterium]